jgi:hypothetical protein
MFHEFINETIYSRFYKMQILNNFDHYVLFIRSCHYILQKWSISLHRIDSKNLGVFLNHIWIRENKKTYILSSSNICVLTFVCLLLMCDFGYFQSCQMPINL